MTPPPVRQFCSNCDGSCVEYLCLDCPSFESNFCYRCCQLHSKIKSTKDHRIILSGTTAPQIPEVVNGPTSRDGTKDGSAHKLTLDHASCSQRTFYSWNNFSSAYSSKLNRLADVAYKTCGTMIDTTDFFDMLTFFEFGVVLNELPLPHVLIPIICLLALVMILCSELTTKNGSLVAIIVGAIAFFRFMQFRKKRKSSHGPIHPNTKKRSGGMKSSRSSDRINVLNQFQKSPTARNHYVYTQHCRKMNDELSDDEVENKDEDEDKNGTRPKGMEMRLEPDGESDEDDFKDEFFYRRNRQVASHQEKKGISHYRSTNFVRKGY